MYHISVAINKTASRNVLRKVTKMINASNSDQRRATSSNFCEEVFSSATEHAADLAHDIDVILQDQDVRQRHHPGEQNRKDECYSVIVLPLLMVMARSNIIFSRLVLTRC